MCTESNNFVLNNKLNKKQNNKQNKSESSSSSPPSVELSPLPGEIWTVQGQKLNQQELNQQELNKNNSTGEVTPIEFSSEDFLEEYQQLYSDVAKDFINGSTSVRYVMIVNEKNEELNLRGEGKVVSVMVLSEETDFISDRDLMIPQAISGLQQDLLAQTCLIVPMLKCQLMQAVGKRLSRKVYDALLDLSDYHALGSRKSDVDVDDTLDNIRNNIRDAGLRIGNADIRENLEYQQFCDRQRDWSDVLTIPVSIKEAEAKGIELTEELVAEIIKKRKEEKGRVNQNQNLNLNLNLDLNINININYLNRWWEGIFDNGWQFFSSVSQFVFALRSVDNYRGYNSYEITNLMVIIDSQTDENQLQKAAIALGEVGRGNSQAVQALVNLINKTNSDETLWTAIQSLWQIDPENPFAGVRRVKQFDLGIQLSSETSVDLAVALFKSANQQMKVLLKVYPSQNKTYLPADLKLCLLDDLGRNLKVISARENDLYMQLKINGDVGEKFSVKLILGEAEITENFIM